MKKFFLVLSVFAASVLAFAQNMDNSFDLRIFGGFGKNYSTVVDSDGDDLISMDSKPQIGISLGSRWYVVSGNVAGLAINARWLDFAFNRAKFDKFLSVDASKLDVKANEFSVEAFNVGLIGTIALGKTCAIDLFYDLGASSLIRIYDNESGLGKYTSDEKVDHYFFGLNHKVGAAFRVGVFQVGVEGKLGKLKLQDWGMEDAEWKVYEGFEPKAKIGCARVFVGFNF